MESNYFFLGLMENIGSLQEEVKAHSPVQLYLVHTTRSITYNSSFTEYWFAISILWMPYANWVVSAKSSHPHCGNSSGEGVADGSNSGIMQRHSPPVFLVPSLCTLDFLPLIIARFCTILTLTKWFIKMIVHECDSFSSEWMRMRISKFGCGCVEDRWMCNFCWIMYEWMDGLAGPQYPYCWTKHKNKFKICLKCSSVLSPWWTQQTFKKLKRGLLLERLQVRLTI